MASLSIVKEEKWRALTPFEQILARSPTETGTLDSGCIGPRAMSVQAAGDEWKDQLASRLGVALQNNFNSSSIHSSSLKASLLKASGTSIVCTTVLRWIIWRIAFMQMLFDSAENLEFQRFSMDRKVIRGCADK
jgi:hypothetical protein